LALIIHGEPLLAWDGRRPAWWILETDERPGKRALRQMRQGLARVRRAPRPV